ncbi:MAG: hypothetical protein ACFB2Z_08870 [Maricaulaceae bacterium]
MAGGGIMMRALAAIILVWTAAEVASAQTVREQLRADRSRAGTQRAADDRMARQRVRDQVAIPDPVTPDAPLGVFGGGRRSAPPGRAAASARGAGVFFGDWTAVTGRGTGAERAGVLADGLTPCPDTPLQVLADGLTLRLRDPFGVAEQNLTLEADGPPERFIWRAGPQVWRVEVLGPNGFRREIVGADAFGGPSVFVRCQPDTEREPLIPIPIDPATPLQAILDAARAETP